MDTGWRYMWIQARDGATHLECEFYDYCTQTARHTHTVGSKGMYVFPLAVVCVEPGATGHPSKPEP